MRGARVASVGRPLSRGLPAAEARCQSSSHLEGWPWIEAAERSKSINDEREAFDRFPPPYHE